MAKNYNSIATSKLINLVIILIMLLLVAMGYVGYIKYELSEIEANKIEESISKPFNCGTVSPYISNNNQRAQELWNSNCTSCHHYYKDFSAKAMAGLKNRIPSEEWFYNFMRSPDSLLSNKEPYTLKLFDSINVRMPSFAWMHDSDLKIMYDYCISIKLKN